MRKIAAFEMFIAYFCIAGLLLWLNRVVSWVPLLMALSVMIVYALVVCNVGTLYRMRYGMWMVWVGAGVVAWAWWYRKTRASTTGRE